MRLITLIVIGVCLGGCSFNLAKVQPEAALPAASQVQPAMEVVPDKPPIPGMNKRDEEYRLEARQAETTLALR